MLEFIYGTGGTGKTTEIIRRIGEDINQQRQVLLLVPEQFSFESERRLYEEYGGKSSLYVEVLTFTRLCNSIFREFGGLAGQPVTDAAKILLMSLTVDQLQDQLLVYRKSATNTSFLETLLQAIGEFKTAGISPQSLEQTTIALEEGRLKEKLMDLSLVYTGYQSLLELGYADPEDDLIRGVEILENNNFFRDYHLYVDGFTTFMSGEFKLLEQMISQSASITFAFTTDSLKDTTQGMGVFSVVQGTIKRLSKMAEKHNVDVTPATYLEVPVRYQKPELSHLSKQFLLPNAQSYQEIADRIVLYEAPSLFSELEWVAATIQRLVREEGYRYRDFAVVSRSPQEEQSAVELIFHRYHIPFFADQRVTVESSPLISGLLAALEAVEYGYQQQKVLEFAKSPLLGLDPAKVAQLENYCYAWQISGRSWKSDFENHPRGLVETFTEKDTQILEEINATRQELMTPLIQLETKAKHGTGLSYATAIYQFLEEIKAGLHMTEYAKAADSEEQVTLLAQTDQIWESLMEILDIFGSVLSKTTLGTSRLHELFRLAIVSTDIGILPQTLDQVLIGGADRIRPSQKRAVFVISVNEGIFPATVQQTGVFSQPEREVLIDAGLEVGGDQIQTALLEQFFGYFAFVLPSERLFVSYSTSSLQGETKLPSSFVTQLERLFPLARWEQIQPWDLVEAEAPALTLLSQVAKEDTPLRATLWDYFEDKKGAIVKRMEESAWKQEHQLANTQVATRLFGSSMRLSPSKVERFYKCPFSYFAQDGLKLHPRKKVEFSPLESGSLIHHVLQVMMEQHGGKQLIEFTIPQLEEQVSSIIMDYLKDRVQDTELLSKRFLYQFQRLCGTLARLLSHLGKEFSQSQFQPVAYELEIGLDKEIKPVLLKTPSGISVVVEGVVDRVDLMEKDGETYLRVVDYKSGNRTFRFSDVLHGLNLQMLIYLFTLQQQQDSKLANTIPAGVLYMPIRENYMNLDRDISPESAQRELEKQWVMSGLVLEDETALTGMEKNLEGLFIPAEIGKNGKLMARSSTIQLEAMEQLGRTVEKEIMEMAQALEEGYIAAYPTEEGIYPSCEHCDYKHVCGYETGDPYRPIERLSHKEVLEELLKEEGEK